MSLWWCSWVQTTPDFRTLTDPPVAGILGWWVSGATGAGVVLVALVQANSERLAKATIRTSWPERVPWRFCDPWYGPRLADRWAVLPWMIERLRGAGVGWRKRAM